jgi:ribosomal protein S18 acetylase RimI-like enzyme
MKFNNSAKTESVVVVLATDNDVLSLEELYILTNQSTFKKMFSVQDYHQATDGDDIWVAKIDTLIVGFVSIYQPDNLLHNLFVLPQYQGKGVGALLLSFAESRLNSPMRLKVSKNNMSATFFYKKYGWQEELVPDPLFDEYISFEKHKI